MPPVIILAAGESSRFWPLSTHGHKSLHRLHGKAIIEHTVESLASAGVTEVILVQSPIARAAHFPHRTVEDQLGDGARYGVTITYVEQTRANGPGPSLQLALPYVSGDFFVANPESINAGAVLREVMQQRGEATAAVAAEEKEEPWLYGVFATDAEGLLQQVVEKPSRGTEPSKLCRTSLELYDQRYADILRKEPEHEHSNVFALQKLAETAPVRVVQSAAAFFPLKYPWHLFAMAEYLGGTHRYAPANVTLGEGASHDSSSVIENDCIIAPGVRIEHSLVGAGSVISSNLSHSILGAAVTIEENVTIEYTHPDSGTVEAEVKEALVDSGEALLGAIIGQGSAVRAGVTVPAGTLIGAETAVEAGVKIPRHIPDRHHPLV